MACGSCHWCCCCLQNVTAANHCFKSKGQRSHFGRSSSAQCARGPGSPHAEVEAFKDAEAGWGPDHLSWICLCWISTRMWNVSQALCNFGDLLDHVFNKFIKLFCEFLKLGSLELGIISACLETGERRQRLQQRDALHHLGAVSPGSREVRSLRVSAQGLSASKQRMAQLARRTPPCDELVVAKKVKRCVAQLRSWHQQLRMPGFNDSVAVCNHEFKPVCLMMDKNSGSKLCPTSIKYK